jgi:signal transduction histidine kinase
MASGINIDLAAAQGRFVSIDAQETLLKIMPKGELDPDAFTRVIGGVISRAAASVTSERPLVAAFGEMVALLWAEGRPDATIQLEQLWNNLANSHTFQLLCAYPSSLFAHARDAMSIEQICGTHSHVIPDESYTAIPSEAQRMRAIALLQQKAQALENEIEAHERARQTLERHEAELLQKNSELRQALAARDEFLSIAAHELKTPITSLQGFTQLLLRNIRRKQEIPPERLEAALDTIELQTRKLTQLVGRLLDSTQIEAGKLRLELVRLDLVALVRSALAQQTSANHKFVLHAPEHLEVVLDPVRFEQVITNLLDNAVKFSPEGGTVAVELAQDAQGTITLAVTDEGMGIPRYDRDWIFDRFQQSHGKHHLSGMGLGLYITREIIEMHGGSIRVEDPAHPGARLVVCLPSLSRAS